MAYMRFLKYFLWPSIAGFIAASVVMSMFEAFNALFFPVPVGLDWSDPRAVHAMTAALPPSAYLLLSVGWFAGSSVGGMVIRKLSGSVAPRGPFLLGSILTMFGAVHIVLLGHPDFFAVIGLPLFPLGMYAGYSARV